MPEYEWIGDLSDDDSLPELSTSDMLSRLRDPQSTYYDKLIESAMQELNRIADIGNTRGAIEQLMFYAYKRGYAAGLDDKEPS